ncbi:MAG TPA: D-alanyl-lipoteichoic acid biosynthesis protein DltD [Gemmatimonadaceae bacterium]
MTAAGSAGSRRPQSLVHLFAGLLALVLFLLAALLLIAVSRWRVHQRIEWLASRNQASTWRWKSIQREVLRHDDLLLTLGSSELVVPMTNRVQDFFAAYPTGFAIAPVGTRGSPIPLMAVDLASLGEAVRGRRVVLSLSGTWFSAPNAVNDSINIAVHASPLQLGDVLFDPALPLGLRERIARRLVHIREVTGNQALLAVPLHCLATHCSFEPLLPALRPLWALRALSLRTEDAGRALAASFITKPAPARRAARIDWARLEAASDSSWRTRSANNPFGIEAKMWSRGSRRMLAARDSTTDVRFVQRMENAAAWDDLALLLATLQALGARPLVLNTPLKGPFLQFTGVSPAARRRFYERFDSLTASFGVPARNFAAYDDDAMFLMEPGSHLSEKGWLVYDRTIDAFYHDSLR